jgi:hypothetical protein
MNVSIKEYNQAQDPDRAVICSQLQSIIDEHLRATESKIWHGAPVWFINGNPIVGYWNRKSGVQLLFWSGQSFDEPKLKAEGSFKAAEIRYSDASEIISEDVINWLKKAETIQWNYKDIVKNKGTLERLG